jgi:hypothetical protein
MKLKEVIEKIDKSKENECWVELTEIASEIGLNDYGYDNEERMKSYFYISWLCTDTRVGAKVYFLDDEAVCVSYQPARKADEHFEWISQEAFEKVRNYILNLISTPNVSVVDLEQEVEEFFSVEFSEQMLTKKAIYNSLPVEIVERYSYGDKWKQTLIKFSDGKKELVTTKDIQIPIYTT